MFRSDPDLVHGGDEEGGESDDGADEVCFCVSDGADGDADARDEQREFDFERKGFVVPDRLDDDDHRCRQHFHELIKTDGVVNKRNICQGDETAEREAKRKDSADADFLPFEHTEEAANFETQVSEDEVNESQKSSVFEVVVLEN